MTGDGRMYGYYWNQAGQYWADPGGTLLGSGWNNTAKLVVAGNDDGNSILYRITTDGNLYWYMFQGIPGQGGYWAHSGVGSLIGNGWGSYRYVTAWGGMFYAVRTNGDMDHLYYPNMDTGDPYGWYPTEKIGEGWYGGNCGFQTVQSGGNGSLGEGQILYAVDGSGRLRWFRTWFDHLGRHWDPTGDCGKIIGNGWM